MSMAENTLHQTAILSSYPLQALKMEQDREIKPLPVITGHPHRMHPTALKVSGTIIVVTAAVAAVFPDAN